MNDYLKIIAGILAAVVLNLILSRNGKDYAVLIVICICCMVCGFCLTYLEKVIVFLRQMKSFQNIDPDMISVLLKTTGIGVLSEITVTICNDAGNSALGKVVQFLTVSIIIWLSLPLFSRLFSLIETILVNI